MARRLEIRSGGVSVVVLRGTSNKTETLLLRRAKGPIEGAWCQVAGGIEVGEQAWETALRELREETGLVPTDFHSTGICEQYYDPKHDRIEVAPVFVAFVGARTEVVLNEEHSEFVWVTLDRAIQEVATPNQREMFLHVRRNFVEQPPSAWTRIDFSRRRAD
jgi:dATP pyrophosphohydrolase